jgi:hypothetical protein
MRRVPADAAERRPDPLGRARLVKAFLTPVRYLVLECRETDHGCASRPSADGLLGGMSWLAWVLGLVCGIVLMVLTTADWRRLPELARLWLMRQRRNAGWVALGAASLAVLAFY